MKVSSPSEEFDPHSEAAENARRVREKLRVHLEREVRIQSVTEEIFHPLFGGKTDLAGERTRILDRLRDLGKRLTGRGKDLKE